VVRVRGRAAHTGLDPEKGSSAVDELARLVLELHRYNDSEAGTAVNVRVVRGGTRHNVVAAEAEVDVGFFVPEEERRIDALVRALRPRDPDTSVEVEGGEVWPAMQRNEKIASLFETACRVDQELGIEVEEAAAGGSSDGCFCAALGVPVLDGLGAVGAGAHAEDEHVVLSSISERASLISAILTRLLR
jgi:glutamate carboxypeptidase